MLDAYIIDRLRRDEEELRRDERPHVTVHIDDRPPPPGWNRDGTRQETPEPDPGEVIVTFDL